MSHARLSIDNETVLDEHMSNWEQRPPEFFKRVMTPGTQHEAPHLTCAAFVLAASLLKGQDVSIDIDTKAPGGWTMSVKQAVAAIPLS